MRAPSIPAILESLSKQPVLAGILLFGFSLRAFNLTWGVPVFDELVGRYHPDEWKISVAAVQFPQFIWQNTDFRYPTFFHLVNAVLFQPFRVVLKVFLNQDPDAIHAYATLFARLISALAGTATIYLCYRLGARLLSHAGGLIAAALCSVSLYHTIDSGYATNDVMTSFFLALLMLQLMGLYTDPANKRRYVLAGITFGILIGVKYTGGVALLMIAMAYGWVLGSLPRDSGSASRRQAALAVTGNYLLMGAAATLAFVASTPGLLIRFDSFLNSLNASRTAQSLHAFRGTSLEIASNTFFDYITAYGAAMIALFLLSITLVPLRSRLRGWQRYYLVSCVALVVAFTLFLGGSLRPRYLVTIAPIIVLSIAAAWQIAQAMQYRWTAAIANVLVGLAVATSLVYVLMGVYSRHGDTRTIAAHYVADQVVPGTTVGHSYVNERYGQSHDWRYPVVDVDGTYTATDMLDNPEILLVSSFDSNRISMALTSPYLSDDLVWDSAGPIKWYMGVAPGPRVFAFYKELFAADGPYRLIAEFTPKRLAPISFPAPTISIYRREKPNPVID